jgi:hypothetical protein
MTDIDKIIAHNPRIDANQLAALIKAVQELRLCGAATKGYDLARPFSIAGSLGKPFGRHRVKR